MVGEQQGNGMGTAWERHGMCESAFNITQKQCKNHFRHNSSDITVLPVNDVEMFHTRTVLFN
jgi:hypothetical protein